MNKEFKTNLEVKETVDMDLCPHKNTLILFDHYGLSRVWLCYNCGATNGTNYCGQPIGNYQ